MSIPMKEKKVVTEVCVNVIPEIYFTFGSIDWIKIKAIDGTIMIEDSSTSRTKALLEQKSIIDSTKKVQSTLDSSQNSKNEFKKEGLKKHSHVRKFDPRNTQMTKRFSHGFNSHSSKNAFDSDITFIYSNQNFQMSFEELMPNHLESCIIWHC
ncbi:hypothetical protein VNO77_27513 [Canavalia gladiata]|uniref:Uncharacterized protein n=1 Tax=Canavalia gladiata TaxID=3824 RepID=A0AAN9KZ02_CANGL